MRYTVSRFRSRFVIPDMIGEHPNKHCPNSQNPQATNKKGVAKQTLATQELALDFAATFQAIPTGAGGYRV